MFVGDGKGKTSAALGVALRMLLIEKRVIWISWFKSEEWQISEMKAISKFPDSLEMYWMGAGFFIDEGKDKNDTVVKKTKVGYVHDRHANSVHISRAKEGVSLAKEILEEGKVDLLVLDEIVRAVSDGLISDRDVIDIIKNRKNTHIVMTGHDRNEVLEKYIDLITEMKKIKHPYDVGRIAERGLDF